MQLGEHEGVIAGTDNQFFELFFQNLILDIF